MSVSLMSLWLPILLGGVFCWIASTMIHMFVKYHNSDYKKLSNEEAVGDVIRAGNPKPGLYYMPFCMDMKDMNDPAMLEKFNKGPVGNITIMGNGMPPMGKLLIQQLSFFIIAGVFIAYISSLSLGAGSEYMTVFRTAMVAGFMSFGIGVIPYSIWYGHPWSNCMRFLLDAIIYGAVMGGTFAWLWPAAT